MSVASLMIGTSAYAQSNAAGPAEGTAGADETYCFGSGSGNAAVSFCVSTTGNVTRFLSPGGFEHIRIATRAEGYAICTGTTILANDVTDISVVNLGAPVLIAGPSATSVTLRRISTDGNWELTQKFSFDKKELDLTITMTLKNLGANKTDVRLARIVDWDNDNTVGGDNQLLSERGVLSNGDGGHSTTLTNTTFAQSVDRALAGFGPACSPASVATPTLSDLTSVVTARLGNMNNGKKAISTFVYRRQ